MKLKVANELVHRMCMLLTAAYEAGTEFAIENPADRGDPAHPELFIHPEHAPLWIMPEMLALQKLASCRRSTFPMCAFGAPFLKYTSILYTPGLAHDMQDLDLLKCVHDDHPERAGGERTGDAWNSARAAAYPADLNHFLAASLSRLMTSREVISQHPTVLRQLEGRGQHSYEASSMPRPILGVHVLT